MAKAADAFRTISEVADWLEVPAHVLRFWESKFTQVKPVKRAGGRRYYRPADMRLLGGIKTMLHDQGMTIKAVQKYLREHGVQTVANLSQPLDEAEETPISAPTGQAMHEVDDAAPSEPAVVSFRRKRPDQTTIEDAEEATVELAGLDAAEADGSQDDARQSVDARDGAEEELPLATPEPDSGSEPPSQEAPPSQELPPPDNIVAAAGETAEEDARFDPPGEAQAPEPEPQQTETGIEAQDDAEGPAPDGVEDAPPEAEAEAEPARTLPPLPNLSEDDPDDDVAAPPGILAALPRLPRPVPPEMAARLSGLRERLRDHAAARASERR